MFKVSESTDQKYSMTKSTLMLGSEN
ncbi:GSCOCT00014242001.2-RA-CDS [Cotesia congregata]|uniref:Cc_bv21.3_28.20_pseudo n=1 Tax=Cotesia congregata TaxID=51543 RepID=A0A8J2MLA4_COTCN|nr:GSCOCT00014242001.2-RA-CDS [Cotesia congregata]CAG5092500.1 cc_bv21.3_28.20_pseudo [Cotesia congregata]